MDLRIAALIRFSIAITILNIVGHLYLGIEQSWLHPLVALTTCYSLEIFFQYLEAKKRKSAPRYKGSFKNLVLFLLPAHITAMAVSMLLFTNKGIWPVVFASSVAICSKVIFRVNIDGVKRHFLNPSNTGIAVILILFPWVGIAPPYQFTENLHGWGDWIIGLIFICVGSFLNTKLTKRMPLILSWFVFFLIQGVVRAFIMDGEIIAAISPMTGIAFLLFSFYMISDPATTPSDFKGQIIFGASVSIVYSILVFYHIVFGQFFALLIVCSVRGIILYLKPYTVRKPEFQESLAQ